jgi:hypothetical protein
VLPQSRQCGGDLGDYREIGDDLLTRFTGGRGGTISHYRELSAILDRTLPDLLRGISLEPLPSLPICSGYMERSTGSTRQSTTQQAPADV